VATYCVTVNKKLAEMITKKCKEPCAFVMKYITKKTTFILLQKDHIHTAKNVPLLQHKVFKANTVTLTYKI